MILQHILGLILRQYLWIWAQFFVSCIAACEGWNGERFWAEGTVPTAPQSRWGAETYEIWQECPGEVSSESRQLPRRLRQRLWQWAAGGCTLRTFVFLLTTTTYVKNLDKSGNILLLAVGHSLSLVRWSRTHCLITSDTQRSALTVSSHAWRHSFRCIRHAAH